MTSSNTPVKIQVAFNVMAYCQSVESTTFDRSPVGVARSPGRELTSHERGMLVAAQNLTRDFLNGELELESRSPSEDQAVRFEAGKTVHFIAPVSNDVDCEDEDSPLDEESPPEDFPF